MFEHNLNIQHRRLRWLSARPLVVDRLGITLLSNKNGLRGSLCSIEHDFLYTLRSRPGPTTGLPASVHLTWHNAPPARRSWGGPHRGMPGSTPPTDGGSTRTRGHQALPGGTRTPHPATRACCHPALDATPPSHWLLRSSASPLIGTAAHRAKGSLGALVTHRVTEPPLCVTHARVDTNFHRHPLLYRSGLHATLHRSSRTLGTERTRTHDGSPRHRTLRNSSSHPHATPRPVGPPYHLPGTWSDPGTLTKSGLLPALGAFWDHE